MWIVRRAEVGRLTYGRLVRDRIVTPLLPGIALPADIPDVPALRSHVLAECVPTGCQATGAAALWAHGVGPTPLVIDIRSAPGRHVRNWYAPLPLVFHGVGLVATDSAIVDEVTAAADARRWAREVAHRERRLAPVIRRAS